LNGHHPWESEIEPLRFAVVADEVRNLAQRAAEAARTTTTLIEESSHNADLGSARVEQVSTAIRQLRRASPK
jgi:methyl-accepting chemotaxis protein